MDRSFLFEKLLDNLELYFDYKRELNEKVKASYEAGDYDTDVHFWQEYQQLENLRELSRRALDEYTGSRPDADDGGEAEAPGA